MRITRSLDVFMAIWLALFSASLFAQTSSGEPILLRSGAISMTEGANHNQGERLAADAPSRPAGPTLYIIQHEDVIPSQWRESIRATGAIIRGYVPQNAYIIEASPESFDRIVGSVEYARLIEYRARFRLDPRIVEQQEEKCRQSAVDGLGAETAQFRTYDISLFDAKAGERVSDRLGKLKGAVVEEVSGSVIRAQLTEEALEAVSGWLEVEWVEPYVAPTLHNNVAVQARRMDVETLWPGGASSLGLTGAGQVVAVADTGLDTGNMGTVHADVRGRIVRAYARGRSNDWSDPNGHGTHVVGSVLGNGANSSSPKIRGVAYGASLIMQSLLDSAGGLGGIPSDLQVLFAQAYQAEGGVSGARIHSDSWGSSVAGEYTAKSRAVDAFMFEHPDFLAVFSSGNDGTDADRNGVIDPRSVGAPATAKNCVTVGSCENHRTSGGVAGETYGWWNSTKFPVAPISTDYMTTGPSGTETYGMAASSSRGPCLDDRIKPDIVAPGQQVLSLLSTRTDSSLKNYYTYNSYYRYNQGTSMAAPLVSGAAALVRQWLVENLHLQNPDGATIKAVLLAGAKSMTPGQYGTGSYREIPAAYPNNVEGWGLADIGNAVANGRGVQVYDGEVIASGESQSFSIQATSAGGKIAVVMAYTDAPASLSSSKQLVNDLDLTVTTPSGSVLYPNSRSSADRVNNVEGIRIASAESGVYMVTVRAYSINTPMNTGLTSGRSNAVRYSLVVNGAHAAGPAAPANDNFAAASAITGSSGRQTGSNAGATSQSGEPLLVYKPSATTTVWWKWTAPSSGSVQFDTTGSSFDTVMGVYRGPSLASLEKVKEDDDGGGSLTSKCVFDCTGGTTYYICVGGYNAGTGTIALNWNLTAVANAVDLTFKANDGWSAPVFLSKSSDGSTSCTSYRQGETIYYNVSVWNIGGLSTTHRFSVRMSIVNSSGTAIHTSVYDNTDYTATAGRCAFYWGNATWSAFGLLSPGSYTFRCEIDCYGEVDESDEGNNVYSLPFTVTGDPSVLSSISVSGPSSVTGGGTATYSCTATMGDGSTRTVTPTWSISGGASYASINASGVLTAQAVTSAQTATVQASYTAGGVTKTATKTVAINPDLTRETLEIAPGRSGTISSTLNNPDGTRWYLDLSSRPSWIISLCLVTTPGGSVISLGSSSSSSIAWTGNAYFSVSVSENTTSSDRSWTFVGKTSGGTVLRTFVVRQAAGTSVTLSSISISGSSSVMSGNTAGYTCTATYSDGSTRTVTPTWSISGGSSYASISAAGVLTAKTVTSSQSVTVQASYTDGGVTRTTTKTVTVNPSSGSLSAIAISGFADAYSGKSRTYVCTASYANGSTSAVTPTWSVSSGSSYASINASGRLSAGTVTSSQNVTVRASYTSDGVTRTATKSVTVYPTCDLASALDNTALAFTTGGDAGWFGQGVTKSDGTDAARSGLITHGQDSWMRTTVTGSGTFAFRWYASSESVNWDHLSFLVDGVLMDRIGGTSCSWAECSYELDAGEHTLEWRYHKDSSVDGGNDAGYVDQVRWTPGLQLSSIAIAGPSSVASGDIVTYACTATMSDGSSRAVTPVWSIYSGSAYASIDASGRLTAAAVTSQQSVTVKASYTEGGAMKTATQTVTITPHIDIGRALDNTVLSFTTGGDAPWFGQSIMSFDDEDAMRSGALEDGQMSWLQTTVEGPGRLSFWWFVNSEEYCDVLEFLIDGIVQDEISGDPCEFGWSCPVYQIDAGSHTLQWRYRKDWSMSEGMDAGFVDLVSWASVPVLSSVSVSGPESVPGGSGSTYVCTATMSDGSTKVVTPVWSISEGASHASINESGRLTASPVASSQNVTVRASYTERGMTKTATMTVSIVASVAVGTALDNTDLSFTEGGAAPWFGQFATTHDGVDALQSGAVDDDQTSWLQTTVEGPGDLSFWWYVSSERDFDVLEFLIDGTVKASISGTDGAWSQRYYSLSAGSHTLQWRYRKDGSVSRGLDAGFVDQVDWTTSFEISNGTLTRYAGPGGAVTIPAGISRIGDEAFANRDDVTSVTIPDGVTEIGARAFYGCTGLTSVKMPSSIAAIGEYAFANCSELYNAYIGQTKLTSISEGLFLNCGRIYGTGFPATLTDIGDYAFSGATSHSGIIDLRGTKVRRIGNRAFYNCGEADITVWLPRSVMAIGTKAFADDDAWWGSSLNRICIPFSDRDRILGLLDGAEIKAVVDTTLDQSKAQYIGVDFSGKKKVIAIIKVAAGVQSADGLVSAVSMSLTVGTAKYSYTGGKMVDGRVMKYPVCKTSGAPKPSGWEFAISGFSIRRGELLSQGMIGPFDMDNEWGDGPGPYLADVPVVETDGIVCFAGIGLIRENADDFDEGNPNYHFISVSSPGASAASLSGLPPGLKYEWGSYGDRICLYGTPTKAGTYKVKVTAADKIMPSFSTVRYFNVVVAALPEWAQGTFTGTVGGSALTVAVGATGKISGKFKYGGYAWTFAAAGFSAQSDAANGLLVCSAYAQTKVGGKAVKKPVTFALSPDPGVSSVAAVGEGTFADSVPVVLKRMPGIALTRTAGGAAAMSAAYGQVATGKKVKLAAKPATGYAFLGWYLKGSDKPFSQAAAVNVAMKGSDYEIEARFKKESELAVPEVLWNAPDELMVGVPHAAVPTASGESPVKIAAVALLPKGLAWKSGKVTGVPTQAGDFKVAVKVVLASNAKKAWIVYVPLSVSALPEWATGTFVGTSEISSSSGGCSACGLVSVTYGQVTLAVGATGRMSGKLVYANATWKLAAASFAAVTEDGLVAKLTMASGSKKKSLVVNFVPEAGFGGLAFSTLFSARQMRWAADWLGWADALSGRTAEAGGVTVAFRANGTAVGVLPFGRYKLTASAYAVPVSYDEYGLTACELTFFFAPNAKIGFKGEVRKVTVDLTEE